MNYNELKQKHQKEIEEFPCFFAFNTEQLEEGKKKLGVTSTDELCAISDVANIIMRKADKRSFAEMMVRHFEEKKELLQDDEILTGALAYELANHEYTYTYDPEPAIANFDGPIDVSTERFKNCLNRAIAICEENAI